MYKARNSQTNKIRGFKTRQAREDFINKENNNYGCYLWQQLFV